MLVLKKQVIQNILEAELVELTHWKESYFSAFADN